MRIILLVSLCILGLMANECEKEKYFWDEIRNSKDIEDFKYYNKKYPNGIYEYIAIKNIKQLRKTNNKMQLVGKKPTWLKGYTDDYKYYAVGTANKHFNGTHYQENLAKSRAKEKLYERFNKANISQDTQYKYYEVMQEKKYIDDKGRVYILLYIDNYDI